MRLTKRSLSIVLVLVVVLGSFVSAWYLLSADTDSTSTTNASPTPTPATGTQNPGLGSQNSSEASRSNANTGKAVDEPINTLITGIVKKEGSGEGITGAVVVLFNGDKRGAAPQLVDNGGQFRFEKVPLKAGATYSLQTKVPGLCGEESFTIDSINAEKAINKDIILKLCQSQSIVQPATTTSTEPGLAHISEGLSGILAPLDSIKFWLQILAITLITTILLFFTTIGFTILMWRPVAEDREQIAILSSWKKRIETELKPGQGKEQSLPSLTLPAEVSTALQQLPTLLTQIATQIATRATPGVEKNNSELELTGNDEQPLRYIKHSARDQESQSQNTMADPASWYRSLLRGEQTSPMPHFVEINSASSDTDVLTTQRRICFDVFPNHGSFVILSDGNGNGWIFPTPRSNFMADHHQVFEELDQRNFEKQKLNLVPKKVRFEDGYWQLVL